MYTISYVNLLSNTSDFAGAFRDVSWEDAGFATMVDPRRGSDCVISDTHTGYYFLLATQRLAFMRLRKPGVLRSSLKAG